MSAPGTARDPLALAKKGPQWEDDRESGMGSTLDLISSLEGRDPDPVAGLGDPDGTGR